MHIDRPTLRQFSARVIDARGEERTTTVTARDGDHARHQLLALGYQRILWVI